MQRFEEVVNLSKSDRFKTEEDQDPLNKVKPHKLDTLSPIPKKSKLRRCFQAYDGKKDKTNMFYEGTRSISSNFSVTWTNISIVVLGIAIYYEMHKCFVEFLMTGIYIITSKQSDYSFHKN